MILRKHQHAGQREGGPGQQQRQRRPLAHARADQPLQDGHLGQGGEVHEGAGNGGEEIGEQRIAAHGPADPRRRDQPLVARAAQQYAGYQHAADEQREDLLGEIPARGEPLAPFALVPAEDDRETDHPGPERQQGLARENERQNDGREGGDDHLPARQVEPDDQDRAQSQGGQAGDQPFHRIYRGEKAADPGRLAPVGENQDRHQREKEEDILPQRPRHLDFGHGHLGFGLGIFLLAENEMHQQADDHAEDEWRRRPALCRSSCPAPAPSG